MYEHGRGVEKDIGESDKWKEIAQTNKDKYNEEYGIADEISSCDA